MKKLFNFYTLFLFSIISHIGLSQSDGCAGVPSLTVNTSCTNSAVSLPGSFSNGGLVSASCTANNRDDGWFSFTATSTSTTVELSGTNRNATLAIWSSCGGGTELGCDQQAAGTTNSVTIPTVIGTTYYIQIHRNGGNNNASLSGSICVYEGAVSGSNYDCTGALPLACGDSFSSTTTGATINTPGSACSVGAYGVWYTFVGDGQSTTISSTGTSGWDHEMDIFTGTCGSLTSVSCEDAGLTDGTESYTFISTSGVTYYVYIAYWSSSGTTTGDFDISRTCTTPPPPGVCGDMTISTTTYSASGLTTCGFGDDYSSSDACGSSYMDGDDIVIEYTPTSTGCVSINLTNTDTWTGVFVTDGCPDDVSTNCLTSATSSSGNPSIGSLDVVAGTTYYITVSTFPSPQCTAFDLNIASVVCPTPPANDDCSGAVSLTMSSDGSCNSVTGTVASATDSGISACGGTANDDVWYSFVAVNDTAYIDRIADFDSEVEVFDGCSGTSLGCQDAESTFELTGLTVGNTYFFRIHSYSSTVPSASSAGFTVCVFGPTPPPANVTCSNQEPICSDSPLTFIASNGGQDADVIEPGNNYDCLSTSPNPTWYYIDIATSGNLDIDITAGSDIDFALWGPYADLTTAKSACGTLPLPIDCSYSASATEQANIAGAVVGEVYILLVTNYADVQQGITLVSASSSTASTSCSAALPVKLLSFTGQNVENYNLLKWKTASEVNNDYFLIEKSFDGINYKDLAKVNGNGNSSNIIEYEFKDEDINHEIIYYRLTQVDYDGVSEKQGVVAISREKDEISIYPNPASKELNFKFKNIDNQQYTIEYVDVTGRVVQEVLVKNNTNEVKSNIFSTLNNGFYLVKISDSNGNIIKTTSLVKN